MRKKAEERVPRLCLGDPARVCLSYAGRKMNAARKAAEAGDRILAGTLTAQAFETGVACLPEAPRSMRPESKQSPRYVWQRLALATIPDAEREANRERHEAAEAERMADYHSRQAERRYRGAA